MHFSLNHMTVANADFVELLDIASAANCEGVELRNDLDSPLFSGRSPADVKASVQERGLSIYAVAEVPGFNVWSQAKAAEVQSLIDSASACGANGISLIPANDSSIQDAENQRQNLRIALESLYPMLTKAQLLGFIEPLGFVSSTLRFKRDAVSVIEELDMADTFKLIHDTFHHYLAGEDEVYPEHTAIVHVSGVIDNTIKAGEMQDQHRVLVDGQDRIGNIDQLASLIIGSYTGPISYEAFSPLVHDSKDPIAELKKSAEYMGGCLRSGLGGG